MKLPTILGLGGVPPGGTPPSSEATLLTFEGHGGILSAALAMPDAEHDRRHRMLERYLEVGVSASFTPATNHRRRQKTDAEERGRHRPPQRF